MYIFIIVLRLNMIVVLLIQIVLFVFFSHIEQLRIITFTGWPTTYKLCILVGPPSLSISYFLKMYCSLLCKLLDMWNALSKITLDATSLEGFKGALPPSI